MNLFKKNNCFVYNRPASAASPAHAKSNRVKSLLLFGYKNVTFLVFFNIKKTLISTKDKRDRPSSSIYISFTYSRKCLCIHCTWYLILNFNGMNKQTGSFYYSKMSTKESRQITSLQITFRQLCPLAEV